MTRSEAAAPAAPGRFVGLDRLKGLALWAIGRRHAAAHHHAHATGGLRADLRLLRGKLGLLLRVCSLCRSLSLLVLLPMSLVNSLGDCLSANALPHLRPFALSGVDRAHKTALRLRRTLASGERNQWATRDPCDMLLFTGR